MTLTRAVGVLLVGLTACGSESSIEHVPFPEVDLLVAFALHLSNQGAVLERSETFGLESGTVSFGKAATLINLDEEAEQLWLVGAKLPSLEALSPWLELSDPSAIEVRDAFESCLDGRLDAEASKLEVPVSRVSLAWRYDASTKALIQIDGAELSDLPISYSLPVRGTGCVSPDSPTLRSFFGDDLRIELPSPESSYQIGHSERLDDDRILVAHANRLGLYDRRNPNPTKPVSVWTAAAGLSVPRIFIRSLEDQGHEVIAAAHRLATNQTEMVVLEVSETSIREVRTATAVAGQAVDFVVDGWGGILMAMTDYALWYSPRGVDGPWTKSTQVDGVAVHLTRATDDPIHPHAVGSRNGGLLLLGDARSDRLMDVGSGAMTLNDFDTFYDGVNLNVWGTTKGNAALEPPRLLRWSTTAEWASERVLVPPIAERCSAELTGECGARQMLDAFEKVEVGGAIGTGEYRVYALPEDCFGVLSYRPSDLCLTYTPIEGVAPYASGGEIDRMHVSPHWVTLFGREGTVYELERGALEP